MTRRELLAYDKQLVQVLTKEAVLNRVKAAAEQDMILQTQLG